jgi:hypothetical protein
MAYTIIRTVIRVDCSPITNLPLLSERIRQIEGFPEMFERFDSFKIGETTNYRNGQLGEMQPDEPVYRYKKTIEGREVVLDLTSRFYYIRITGENQPENLDDYCKMLDDIKNKISDIDIFVYIEGHAIGKDFEERQDNAAAKESSNRDSYLSQPENVRIIYQDQVKDGVKRAQIAAVVKDVERKASREYQLFNQTFKEALRKAERDYGLR